MGDAAVLVIFGWLIRLLLIAGVLAFEHITDLALIVIRHPLEPWTSLARWRVIASGAHVDPDPNYGINTRRHSSGQENRIPGKPPSKRNCRQR